MVTHLGLDYWSIRRTGALNRRQIILQSNHLSEIMSVIETMVTVMHYDEWKHMGIMQIIVYCAQGQKKLLEKYQLIILFIEVIQTLTLWE